MKLATVEKKTFLAGLQCTLTSSCAKNWQERRFNLSGYFTKKFYQTVFKIIFDRRLLVNVTD